DYDQCLSIAVNGSITSQYCLLELGLPLPPKPFPHNFHYKTHVLDRYNFDKYLANTTIYRQLEENASLLYYLSVQLGICLPQSCSKGEITAVVEKSKFQIFSFIFLIIFFGFRN